jgi:hypothetical protein
LRPGLGGEHHCRRLIDAERAIDRGESRTSASRVTLREIYANRIPLPDPACRGLVVDTADQLIAAGQAAEQQPRSHARNKRNEPGEPGTGATQVRRSGASRSREFCNLPGRNATPEGPGR